MTPLELFSNVFNLLSVFFAARNSVLTWGTGIVGGVLFAVLFFQQRLYADVCLQIFFIVTSIFGWYMWIRGGNARTELPITRVRRRRFAILALLASLLALITAYAFMSWTNASYPIIDSHILTFSILGQLLLMRRKVDNWLCWILVDTLAVPLYFVKGLTLTAVIYAAFLVNAFVGYFLWRKKYGSLNA